MPESVVQISGAPVSVILTMRSTVFRESQKQPRSSEKTYMSPWLCRATVESKGSWWLMDDTSDDHEWITGHVALSIGR